MAAYVSKIRGAPRSLTPAEQKRILSVTGDSIKGFRDHMIIALALGTALRSHEIVALDIGDILGADGRIKRRVAIRVFKGCRRRGGTEDIFLPDTLVRKLHKFLGSKKRLVSSDPLFVGQCGRLSTRMLRHLFREWQKRAGFEGELFGFHALRHSALTNIQRKQGDIMLTQRAARHKSPMSTAIYTKPSDEDLLRVVKDLPC